MRVGASLAVIVLLGTLPAASAGAACLSRRCGPEHAALVQAVREELQAKCDCAGASDAKAYRRCVKRALSRSVAGGLSKACAATVERCERQSTCGRADALVCCRRTKRRRVVGTVTKRPNRCKGTVCPAFRHAVDACDGSGPTACAEAPATSTTTLAPTTTTTGTAPHPTTSTASTPTTTSTTTTSVPLDDLLPPADPDPCAGSAIACRSARLQDFVLVSTEFDGLVTTVADNADGPVMSFSWTPAGDAVELVVTLPEVAPITFAQFDDRPASLGRANLAAAAFLTLGSNCGGGAFNYAGCDCQPLAVSCTALGGCCDRHDACINEHCRGEGDSGDVRQCLPLIGKTCSPQCMECHTTVIGCYALCANFALRQCLGPSSCCEAGTCGEAQACYIPGTGVVTKPCECKMPEFGTCEDGRGGNGDSSGDPHLVTFDRLAYDFQAVGEFVLVRSLDDGLEVQARQAPWGDRRDVSVNAAVAMRVGSDRVAIYADRDPPVLVNGTPIMLATGETALAGGGTIEADGGRYAVRWPDGSSVRVRRYEDHLDLELFLPGARRGRVAGLLGDFDDDFENDLVTRDGTPVGLRPTFAALYARYGETWRITQTESLFDYAADETTATFTDRAFPSELVDAGSLPADVRQRAEATCRAAGVTDPVFLDACILDVALTGESTFALGAATLRPPAGRVLPTGYFSGFEGIVGAEWSRGATQTTPVGARRFLGQFDNETVSLTLADLPPHTQLTVSFELFVIQSWDGNDAARFGDDVWRLGVRDGPTLLQTTFANYAGSRQAYPDSYPGGDNPALSGAAEVATLGYNYLGPADSVYRLSFTFSHAASAVVLDFSGSGLQGVGDEGWGLDNVQVIAE